MCYSCLSVPSKLPTWKRPAEDNREDNREMLPKNAYKMSSAERASPVWIRSPLQSGTFTLDQSMLLCPSIIIRPPAAAAADAVNERSK